MLETLAAQEDSLTAVRSFEGSLERLELASVDKVVKDTFAAIRKLSSTDVSDEETTTYSNFLSGHAGDGVESVAPDAFQTLFKNSEGRNFLTTARQNCLQRKVDSGRPLRSKSSDVPRMVNCEWWMVIGGWLLTREC